LVGQSLQFRQKCHMCCFVVCGKCLGWAFESFSSPSKVYAYGEIGTGAQIGSQNFPSPASQSSLLEEQQRHYQVKSMAAPYMFRVLWVTDRTNYCDLGIYSRPNKSRSLICIRRSH
jgi:hypothetical protein